MNIIPKTNHLLPIKELFLKFLLWNRRSTYDIYTIYDWCSVHYSILFYFWFDKVFPCCVICEPREFLKWHPLWNRISLCLCQQLFWFKWTQWVQTLYIRGASSSLTINNDVHIMGASPTSTWNIDLYDWTTYNIDTLYNTACAPNVTCLYINWICTILFM